MLTITPIPALSDNYIWVIQQKQEAVVVDPAEAAAVLAFLAKNQLNLTAILLTHAHHDHTDGVTELVQAFPKASVYGSAETAQWATCVVTPNSGFQLFDVPVKVLGSSGHTAEHISYLVAGEHLFCGDALFSAGCGRVFTGDYQAQFETLQRFKQLPDWVQVYAGHEYTQSNLKFAVSVMPPTCVLMEYQERVDMLRLQHQPTLPTTIGIEKQINPFMQAETLATFIALRQQKDQF